MNANIAPDSGSSWITSRARIASPSICFSCPPAHGAGKPARCPRSGRSIPAPREYRRHPARRRPLPTLDRPAFAHTRRHTKPPGAVGSTAGELLTRTATKPTLALARPLTPRPAHRAGAAPQSRRTPAAAQDPSPSRNHSVTRRLAAPLHASTATRCFSVCLCAIVYLPSRWQLHCPLGLTTEERASLSAYPPKAPIVCPAWLPSWPPYCWPIDPNVVEGPPEPFQAAIINWLPSNMADAPYVALARPPGKASSEPPRVSGAASMEAPASTTPATACTKPAPAWTAPTTPCTTLPTVL